jgi:H+/gluconate symporter-like permease
MSRFFGMDEKTTLEAWTTTETLLCRSRPFRW